jgi:hypothetical protein
MKKLLIMVWGVLFLAGCTSVAVSPVKTGMEDFNHVCIRDNSGVYPGFKDTLVRGFEKHNITSEVFLRKTPKECTYVLNYSVQRDWDIVMFVSSAELRLTANGKTVATGEYQNSSGFWFPDVTKYSTDFHIHGVIDKMLENRQVRAQSSPMTATPVANEPEPIAIPEAASDTPPEEIKWRKLL